ncbi:MAG TPA: ACP S-malonyltransferase [Rhizomicrobium sp.]|jgi:[acyl-carrier-protein] S-malonyltransferase|nr:ACP S-malonyltransferase [Rhizomicrobium sp.]
MTRAFIFPGQGSQTVGMGKALAEAFAPARELFEEIDEALNQSLSRLMWEGPEADLTLTENAQPAIMAASMAIVRVLEREAGLEVARHARVTAGHSLGEYTALSGAGSFTVSDTARLLRTRGQAMQAAVPVGKGAMSALLGADLTLAEEAVQQAVADAPETEKDPVCVIANDNAPGQIVISGTAAAVERAGAIAKTKGAKRAIPLAVSAPFHSPLMQPAAEKMREALSGVTIRPPAAPLIANVTSAEVSESETIRRLLVEQITGRVRWRESVLRFRHVGVETTVEFGGNKVLTTMVKRIDGELQTVSLNTPADIEAFAKTL